MQGALFGGTSLLAELVTIAPQWAPSGMPAGVRTMEPPAANWHRAPTHSKILHGAKPADLPVEQPTHSSWS
jgi:hypothetical protein